METIVVVRKYKYLKFKENKQTNKQKPVATSVNVKKKIITMLIFPNIYKLCTLLVQHKNSYAQVSYYYHSYQ